MEIDTEEEGGRKLWLPEVGEQASQSVIQLVDAIIIIIPTPKNAHGAALARHFHSQQGPDQTYLRRAIWRGGYMVKLNPFLVHC